MPQLGGDKKKQRKAAQVKDDGRLVSAYSEEGQARLAKDRKRNRTLGVIALVSFFLVLTAAVVVILILTFNR